MLLTAENFRSGFLVDDDFMAGVSQDPNKPDSYVAFVLRHTTGEYMGYQAFGLLDEALKAINQIKRPWAFERLGGCGGCEGGKCGGGKCAQGGCKAGACETSV